MTEQNDELKNLFRQKHLENAFPLDEQNWDSMSRVLKKDKRKKRFIYLSFLLLLLGLGSAWLIIKHKDTGSHTLALNSKAEPGSNTAGSANLPAGIGSPGKYKNTSPGKEAYPAKPVIQKVQVQIQQAAPANPGAPISHQPADTRKNAAAKVPFNEQQAFVAVKETKPKTVSRRTENQLKNTSSIIERTKEKESEPPIASAKNISNIPGIVTNASEQVPASGSSKVMGKTVDLNPEELGSVPGSFLAGAAATDPAVKEASLLDTIIPDMLTSKMLPGCSEERNIDPSFCISEKDHISPHPNVPGRVFIEAGTSFLPGWKANGKTEANGFNPLMGLHYDRDIYKKLGFSLGLQYTTIANLSQTSHTSATTRIKFGEEADYTVISAQKMHYVLLPVKLNYSLTRNDIIGIGYTLAYLMDVESTVKTYSTRAGYSSAPVVSKSRGYTSGFNTYDGQLTLSYRRRLCKKGIFVNAAFFYGLNDIKNHAYSENNSEKACGFRLSLDINVFKK